MSGMPSVLSEQHMTPRVSVVMPSMNQARFIESAIRSVLDQDVAGLELVIADGGSTDGTLKILERMTLEYGSRLCWISQADHGPVDAINQALTRTSGEIIGWLNSDDLYADGAIARAVAYFKRHPDSFMVYGRGEHIDEADTVIAEYPTLPPKTPLEKFRDGCFICQPTVFLRREVFDEVGYLDQNFSVAFDFEFWMRIFTKHPDRIGFIRVVQAYTRLHADTITSTSRCRIAMEGTKILGTYLGSASPAWLLNYFEELFEVYPHVKNPAEIFNHCNDLVSEALPYLSESDAALLRRRLNEDRRFRLALPDAFITVYADGCLPPVGFLRLRLTGQRWRMAQLTCRHVFPRSRTLDITVMTPWGAHHEMQVTEPGPFEIRIALPAEGPLPSYLSFPIKVRNGFVPADEFHNGDHRELAFMVEKIELLE
jgi:glycosyltransferase involved in cell wall biosynthesis